jgi:predicted membrane channel-forming protein YqfA (hemolysin III family)
MIAWAIHFTIGVNNPLETSTLNGILLMYACYASVLLCIFHLPERLVPQGTVDIFGFSHQIFHVGVIGGVTALFWTYN